MVEFTTWHASFPDFFHKPPTLTLYRYWKTIIDFKWQKQGSRSSFRPLTGCGLQCTNCFENFREISLKRDLSNDTTANPPLFSWVNPFKDLGQEVSVHAWWIRLKVVSFRKLFIKRERRRFSANFSRPPSKATLIYFQITSPGNSTVTPLYQWRRPK
jgi:hypothetical protein